MEEKKFDKYFLSVFKNNYFDIKGVVTQRELVYFYLYYLLIEIFLVIIYTTLNIMDYEPVSTLISNFWNLFTILPVASLIVRRLNALKFPRILVIFLYGFDIFFRFGLLMSISKCTISLILECTIMIVSDY